MATTPPTIQPVLPTPPNGAPGSSPAPVAPGRGSLGCGGRQGGLFNLLGGPSRTNSGGLIGNLLGNQNRATPGRLFNLLGGLPGTNPGSGQPGTPGSTGLGGLFNIFGRLPGTAADGARGTLGLLDQFTAQIARGLANNSGSISSALGTAAGTGASVGVPLLSQLAGLPGGNASTLSGLNSDTIGSAVEAFTDAVLPLAPSIQSTAFGAINGVFNMAASAAGGLLGVLQNMGNTRLS